MISEETMNNLLEQRDIWWGNYCEFERELKKVENERKKINKNLKTLCLTKTFLEKKEELLDFYLKINKKENEKQKHEEQIKMLNDNNKIKMNYYIVTKLINDYLENTLKIKKNHALKVCELLDDSEKAYKEYKRQNYNKKTKL